MISLKIKTPSFRQYNKSLTLNQYTDKYELIIAILMRLFQENFVQSTIRLIGVTLSGFVQNKELEVSSELFDIYQKKENHYNEVSEWKIAEQINKKFLKNIISIAEDKLK
jgi:hypothetical protein